MTHSHALQIRPFSRTPGSNDTTAVVALWQRCELTRPWNDPERDIERKLALDDELFLVAEQDGRIVGSVMAGYDGHRGWINYLAVEPVLQGSGLGRQLMNAAEAKLLALGCPKVNLQIRAGNDRVMAFYEAIGYGRDEVVSYGKRLIPDQ